MAAAVVACPPSWRRAKPADDKPERVGRNRENILHRFQQTIGGLRCAQPPYGLGLPMRRRPM